MSKTFFLLGRYLTFVSLILITTIFFSACADDQDDATTTPDSPAVNNNDTGARQATTAANGGKDKREPQDLDTSYLPILALLRSDATHYSSIPAFILRYEREDTTDAKLTERKFGPWYGVKFDTRITPRNKERLNLHIHGYLTYHDMAAKDPPVRHTLFLKWHRRGNLDSVTVWIYPAPVETKDAQGLLLESDPPRPRVPPPPPME